MENLPDHLTCLLRNLYAGLEATVRTLYGTADWFTIATGVWQGCLMSPCLFSLYIEIHQKIIWMLSNFHKITSEHWQRTPGTQKGSPFSSKGGRTKYNRQRVTDGDLSWEGVVKKFSHSRKPSHRWVCGGFWNLRRQHNLENTTTTNNNNKKSQNTDLTTTAEKKTFPWKDPTT